MSLNYLINASNNVSIQGIGVAISTSFQHGTIPSILNFEAKGMIQNADEARPGIYANLTGVFDMQLNCFNSINGVNIPKTFIQELETKIIETYEQIKQEQEVNNEVPV